MVKACLMLFMANGFTFKETSMAISFLPPLSMGDKSYRREFAVLGADSLLPGQTPLSRVSSSGEAARRSQSLIPFMKMVEKDGCVPMHLN